MKISKKTDYALRTLFSLVEYYGFGPVPIRELATKNQIPKRFLEHIMLDLKAQGWVKSSPGKKGGYVLAKKPEEITLGQIIRHFDGVLAPIGCVSVTQYKRCSEEEGCKFRSIMANIRDCVSDMMERANLQDIYQGSFNNHCTVVSVSYYIDGDGI